jgi:hypothetical protein
MPYISRKDSNTPFFSVNARSSRLRLLNTCCAVVISTNPLPNPYLWGFCAWALLEDAWSLTCSFCDFSEIPTTLLNQNGGRTSVSTQNSAPYPIPSGIAQVRSVDNTRGRDATPDEKWWLFVGRQLRCPPWPEHSVHPSTLLYEAQRSKYKSTDFPVGFELSGFTRHSLETSVACTRDHGPNYPWNLIIFIRGRRCSLANYPTKTAAIL